MVWCVWCGVCGVCGVCVVWCIVASGSRVCLPFPSLAVLWDICYRLLRFSHSTPSLPSFLPSFLPLYVNPFLSSILPYLLYSNHHSPPFPSLLSPHFPFSLLPSPLFPSLPPLPSVLLPSRPFRELERSSCYVREYVVQYGCGCSTGRWKYW